MYHLDNTSGVPEMPEPKDTQSISPRWFGESQDQGGISWPGADWFNIIQAELLNVLIEAGIEPAKASYNQIAQAIKEIGGDALFQKLSSGNLPGTTLVIQKIQATGAKPLAVYDKLLSLVSVLDFIDSTEHAAIRDKTSTLDLTADFQRAAAYALTVRKRLYIPAGQYYVTSGSFSPGLGVTGDGMGNSILVTGVGTGAVIASLGYWESGDSWKNTETCVLDSFSVQVPEGNFYPYDSSFDIGYDYSKTTIETPIQLGYYKRLEIRSVGVSWSRGFSILATRNQELLIDGCHIDHSMRDAIRSLGNQHTKITNNIVRHCGDDCITVGTNFGGEDKTSWGDAKEKVVVVMGNIGIDTKGIRALGAMNTSIIGNVLQRPKESAVIVGGRDGTEGMNDPGFIIVSNNIINDLISGEWIHAAGGSNTANSEQWNTGITLMTRIVNAGDAAAIPGQFDYSGHKFVLPETYCLSSLGAEFPSAGMRNISITGNIINRTLPYAGHYSGWGFDNEVFTPTGWVDPDVSSGMRSGRGINVRANSASSMFSIMGMRICDNIINGFEYAIDLSPVRYLAFTEVKDNSFIRYATAGLKLTSGNFGNSVRLGVPQGPLEIKQNRFDADPYLEHTNRNTNGTWNAIDYPAGVECSNATGLDIQGNTFRNLTTPVTSRLRFLNNAESPSMNGTGILRSNTYICQPASEWTDSIDGTANNAGVRFIGSPNVNDFIFENSNPLSATYLQVLGATGAKSAPSIPTSGFHLRGTFVSNTTPAIQSETITNSSGATFVHRYALNGWLRLTTGITNSAGTDWVPSKSTISMSTS